MKTSLDPGVLLGEDRFVCMLEKHFHTSYSSSSDLELLYQTEIKSKHKTFNDSLSSLHTVIQLQGSTTSLHLR